MSKWKQSWKDEKDQKLLFDGLGDGWVGGDDLMKTLEVNVEGKTYTFTYEGNVGNGFLYKMIEYCEENDIKWDVTYWKKMIQTKNGESY